MGMVNALSFDLEDWFHMIGIPGVEDPRSWDSLPSVLERRSAEILDLLAARQVRATFFVLGWIAERYPHLIRDIAARGHEIGTHSHWHRPVTSLTPRTFAEDLRRSIAAIEAACGQRPHGFRAPSFSIIPGVEWAFDVILEAGLAYDASLFPAPRSHGGYPCPPGPHRLTTPNGRQLPELPMSTTRLCGREIGFSGGGYLRLLPGALICQRIARLNAAGLPAVVYLHPADFATDRPHVAMPLLRRFKTRIGLASTLPKLQRLLERFRFDSCATVLGPVLGPPTDRAGSGIGAAP